MSCLGIVFIEFNRLGWFLLASSKPCQYSAPFPCLEAARVDELPRPIRPVRRHQQPVAGQRVVSPVGGLIEVNATHRDTTRHRKQVRHVRREEIILFRTEKLSGQRRHFKSAARGHFGGFHGGSVREPHPETRTNARRILVAEGCATPSATIEGQRMQGHLAVAAKRDFRSKQRSCRANRNIGPVASDPAEPRAEFLVSWFMWREGQNGEIFGVSP